MPRAAKLTRPVGKNPSILIIEDNVALSSSLQMLLEAQSFDVSCTGDGVGGVRNVELMDFDVILCDLVMPNLPGDLFYEAVKRIKPHLADRFIFMSGEKGNAKWEEFVKSTGCKVLWKPFPLPDLMNAIRSVQDQRIPEEATVAPELAVA